ncbi:MAG TPA: hypothetical protein PLV92_01515, partial [Pirellulaceae bacterium]|nr:hypothetical protein [Pirellulaceae bacterium]
MKSRPTAEAGRNVAPTWKTRWPKTDDLRRWYQCALEKCDAFSELANGATEAHLPIEGLADLGHTSEALKHVDRYLKRLQQLTRDSPLKVVHSASLEILRMASLGAKICLDGDDLNRMEHYLSIALETERLPRRKCDIGYPERAVRDFRARHGLLDPADAIDASQREEATFTRADRGCHHCAQAGDIDAAKAELGTMFQIASQAKDRMCRYFWARRVIEGYVLIDDAREVTKVLRFFEKDPAVKIRSFDFLHKNGFEKEAIKAAKDEILKRVAELESMRDPNIHFP